MGIGIDKNYVLIWNSVSKPHKVDTSTYSARVLLKSLNPSGSDSATQNHSDRYQIFLYLNIIGIHFLYICAYLLDILGLCPNLKIKIMDFVLGILLFQSWVQRAWACIWTVSLWIWCTLLYLNKINTILSRYCITFMFYKLNI